MWTCNRLDLQTLGSQLVIMPKNLPHQCTPLATGSKLHVNMLILKNNLLKCGNLGAIYTLAK